MSVVIDLTIEHVSHQLLTGNPFSPEGEVEVFSREACVQVQVQILFLGC